ncbi:hypothetical protein H0H93_014397, partial [Arthromyces matolae]
ADESQRRHYNDGYSPYSHQLDFEPNTRPFSTVSDPFNTPAAEQRFSNPYDHETIFESSILQPPPPPPQNLGPSYAQHDPYAHPLSPGPPPVHTLSPGPPPNFLNPYPNPGPPPSTTPLSSGAFRSPYEPHDEHEHDGHVDPEHEGGDIPLLRRDHSQSSSFVNVDMPIPGAFGTEDDEGNNIRYGRIPQRIPRRYKTIKKVE